MRQVFALARRALARARPRHAEPRRHDVAPRHDAPRSGAALQPGIGDPRGHGRRRGACPDRRVLVRATATGPVRAERGAGGARVDADDESRDHRRSVRGAVPHQAGAARRGAGFRLPVAADRGAARPPDLRRPRAAFRLPRRLLGLQRTPGSRQSEHLPRAAPRSRRDPRSDRRTRARLRRRRRRSSRREDPRRHGRPHAGSPRRPEGRATRRRPAAAHAARARAGLAACGRHARRRGQGSPRPGRLRRDRRARRSARPSRRGDTHRVRRGGRPQEDRRPMRLSVSHRTQPGGP